MYLMKTLDSAADADARLSDFLLDKSLKKVAATYVSLSLF